MPNGVFASDQYTQSVRPDDEQSAELAAQEVIGVDEAPEPNLEDPDW